MIYILHRIFLFSIFLSIVIFGALSSYSVSETSRNETFRILVAYNSKALKASSHILDAYTSVLEEEGVAFEAIDQHHLLAVDPADLAATVPAVIFPDALCQHMPEAFEPWIENYLMGGGGVAAIYDPAIKSVMGAYLPNSLLQKFTGINHSVYTRQLGKAYGVGGLRFTDGDAAKACEIPYGKLDPMLFLTGYGYGRLQYPMARNEFSPEPGTHPSPVVLAESVIDETDTYPAIVTRQYGDGHVLYVNMPLGHLKANADDLPLRSILRFFLFRTLHMPHLMNVPHGKGGIVFNWHHDSNADWPYLKHMIESNLFRPNLQYSMHITAGDSVDQPGDGLGFDACGKGEHFVKMLKPYGAIGSHGGWYHNWFATKIASGAFGLTEIKEYVHRNNACLESLTDDPIIEYSAPRGVYPPATMTEILSEMGVIAYYYTGDSGSMPNRSFFNGKMLSDRMIAFPVMPLVDKAALVEFNAAEIEEAEIHRWLQRTADYAIRNRTVRMLYSHPYGLYPSTGHQGHQETFRLFLDHLENAQAAGRLTVKPMSYYADFMLKMLKANCKYLVQPKGIEVHVQKPAGLSGLTLSFPKNRFLEPQGENLDIQIGIDAYYATLNSAAHDTFFFVPTR